MGEVPIRAVELRRRRRAAARTTRRSVCRWIRTCSTRKPNSTRRRRAFARRWPSTCGRTGSFGSSAGPGPRVARRTRRRWTGVGIGFDIDHTLAIDNRLERVAFLRLLEAILERRRATRWEACRRDRCGSTRCWRAQREGEFTIDDAVRRVRRESAASSPHERYVERFRDDGRRDGRRVRRSASGRTPSVAAIRASAASPSPC